MRITESRLRNIISNVISEMSSVMPMTAMSGQGVGHDMSSFMNKAMVCCDMDAASLFDMCVQIYNQNPNQSSHCAELFACACRGDVQGCCRCLGEICKCSHCEKICSDCCGC